MSEIVEKVARAMDPGRAGIADKLVSLGCARSAAIGVLPLKEARAAIEAMMEGITPAMLESMEEMYMPFGEMRAAWDGAFIAALSDPE